MNVEPRISVIVPMYNGANYIEACLAALMRQTLPPHQIIVVDDASSDDSAARVRQTYPQVMLKQNTSNLGFARTVNAGLACAAAADFVCLLNQDTVADAHWLSALHRAFQCEPQAGIVGSKIFYPDQRVQHAGGYLVHPQGHAGHFAYGQSDDGSLDEPREVEFVTGAALMISPRALQQIGPLAEEISHAYYEDVDWCYRARAAGFQVRYEPSAAVIHREHSAIASRSYRQQLYYHCGRVHFVLKHWTAAAVNECMGAELQDIAQVGSLDECKARARAYLLNAAQLSLIRARRADVYARDPSMRADAGFWQAVFDQLMQAREAAMRQSHALVAHETASSVSAQLILQQSEIEALLQQARLQEYEFSSRVPLVGGLVAALRRLWFEVAARWALSHLSRQQSEFNVRVARILQALTQEEGELWREMLQDTRALAEQIQRIEMHQHGDSSEDARGD